MSIIRTIINYIKKFIPKKIWYKVKKFKTDLNTKLYYNKIHIRYKFIVFKLRKKEKIKVAFFLIHDSVWKYEGVYRLMEKSERFEPIVVVCPYVLYGEKIMLNDMNQAYNSFKSKGYNVIKTLNEETGKWLDVKTEIKPDIVFFTNPHKLTKGEYYINNYLDCLTYYVPYSFQISFLYELQFNQEFHNLMYKGFYETKIHKQIAKDYSKIGDQNIKISGYPGLDILSKSKINIQDPWKKTNKNLKKIIWAPHYTIDDDQSHLNYSNFLNYSDYFLEIAEKYSDKIMIAFKPHPVLKTRLYNHNEWGIKRTDEYYKKWQTLPNCQLELGDYSNLFLTSDAMIHDSGSFMVEYLYTTKPTLFTVRDSDIVNRFNEFGKLAFNHHYHAFNKVEIENFIQNVIINGNDILCKERLEFIRTYLIKDSNKTSSEWIYNEIAKNLKKR